MMVHLSREARRRMARLVGSAESAIAADAKFFERFPGRSHRVRLADRAEVEQFGVLAGRPYLQLAPDQLAFVLIHQVAPGVRLKAVVAGPAADAGENRPEEFAAGLWAEWTRLHPHVAEKQRLLKEAAGQPGGPLHEGGSA